MGITIIGEADFAAAMDRFGPWPQAPRLAIAVSGGPDSLALLALADRWARAHAGSVVALTVDHGLRAEAAAEAAALARHCAGLGIDHRTLRWRPPPGRTSQASARAARYGLLDAACRTAGIVHLLVGHTADDQAETVALRQAAGSGEAGLAGMSAMRVLDHCRVLRPLLGFARSATLATCEAMGLRPFADPSNRDRRYARVRARQALAGDGDRRDGLLTLAHRAGQARRDSEARLADLLARAAQAVDRRTFALAPWAVGDAMAPLALAALVRAVGGRPHAPDPPACRRAIERVKAGRARQTLGRCLIAAKRDAIVIGPEPPRRQTARGAANCPQKPLAMAGFAVVYPRANLT